MKPHGVRNLFYVTKLVLGRTNQGLTGYRICTPNKVLSTHTHSSEIPPGAYSAPLLQQLWVILQNWKVLLQDTCVLEASPTEPSLSVGPPCVLPVSSVNLTAWFRPLTLFYFIFFGKFIYFNWRLITLQYCSGFAIYHMNRPWVYVCPPSWTPLPPPSPSHPSGLSQCTSPEHPVSCIKPGWWSISHMVIYMFQC